MKIDSSLKPSPSPLGNRQTAKAPATPAPETEFSLSALAGSLQAREQMPVNAARVQEIKDAIAQGKFRINPEAIAGSLIETARDLLNSQRQA